MRKLLLVVLPLLLTPSVARPCSPHYCEGDYVVPRGEFPSNYGAILWGPDNDVRSSTVVPEVHFESETGALIDATLEVYAAEPDGPVYRVTPAAPFEEGQIYHLVAPRCISQEPLALTPMPSVPLPTTLGELVISQTFIEERTQYANAEDYCAQDKELMATVVVHVELSQEALPWQNVLEYTTKLDGRVWSTMKRPGQRVDFGAAPSGRGFDTFSTLCSVPNAALSGTHTVELEARVIGTDTVVSTGVQTFELRCPDDEEPDANDTGCTSTRGEGALPVLFLVMGLWFARRKLSARTVG